MNFETVGINNAQRQRVFAERAREVAVRVVALFA